MRYEIRFFNETDSETVQIEARNADDRQDQIDALWDQDNRNDRFDGVEW